MMRRGSRVGVRIACAVASVALTACAIDLQAFVPRRDASGQPLFRVDPSVVFVFHSRNPGGQHDAWRAAMQVLGEASGSALSIIEDPSSPSSVEPQVGDGINTVALMDGNGWSFYSPEDPVVVVKCVDPTGEVVEDDIFFNALDFDLRADADGSYAHERVLDMETIALAAFVEAAANLDHSIRYSDVMFAESPAGRWKRVPAATEAAALRALFPEQGASEATIFGAVRKNDQGVAHAYVCAGAATGQDEYCGLTDATGNYTIRSVQPGTYRLTAMPTTTNPDYVLSPVYRVNHPTNVNFSALEHAAPVVVSAGASAGPIDFAVSTTASAPGPEETLEPVPIVSDGTPLLFNTWPPGDEDRAVLTTAPNECVVLGTDRVGVAAASVDPDVALTRTALSLHDGAALLLENESRNPAEDDPRSLMTFCEGPQSRTLELAARQRRGDVAGAGHHFQLFARSVGAPAGPDVDSVTPSTAVAGYETFVAIDGSGFLPGAQVIVDAKQATLEAVDDCDAAFDCRRISAAVPASVGPGSYDVTVENPDGRSATLADALEYLPLSEGAVFDMFWWGEWPLPGSLADATGLCWGDYDDDGDPDLFRAGDSAARLLRNDGESGFTDVSGTGGIPGWDFLNPMYSCAWGDVDNDGDVDLYVTMLTFAADDLDRLYVNRLSETGTPTFDEEAAARGITEPFGDVLTRPVFLDHDRDGDLDIFVASGANATSTPLQPNRLYRNDGTGHFTEVGDLAGVAMGDAPHRTVDVVVADLTGDGWDDLFLINLPEPGGHDGSDVLLANARDGGFTDMTESAGVDSIANCNNGQAGDFNNDARLDLVCFLSSKAGAPPARLYLDNGDGTFTDVAVAAGLTYPALPPRWCSSMTLLDHDLDGDTDIYLGCRQEPGAGHPNDGLDLLLSNDFLETGVVSFKNVTTSSGLDLSGNYDFRTDVATALDHDGDLDFAVFKTGNPSYDLIWDGLQSNPGFPPSLDPATTKDAIKIRLQGTLSNPQGIGARVTAIRSLGLPDDVGIDEDACLSAIADPQESRTGWMLADGHNQNPHEIVLAFDLPRVPQFAGTIECVVVDWPSGYRQAFATLPINTAVTLVEHAKDLTVVRVVPSAGAQTGGEPVTVAGFAFESGARVFFGAYEASGCTTLDSRSIACATPTWQPPGPVDVTVVNPDQSSATLPDGFTFVGSLGIETVDPDPDLRIGAEVASATDILARSWARDVVGIAADGASRVVLRMQVSGPGDEVTFRLRNENGVVVQPDWGYGVLYEPATAPGELTELTVQSRQATDGTWWAFAVLRAPDDARAIDADFEESPPIFFMAKTEPFFIEAEYCPGAPCAGTGQIVQRQFAIYRPPVVLLGGGFSDDDPYGWEGSWLPFYAYGGLEDLEEIFYVFHGNFAGISDRHFAEIVTYWDDAIVDGAIRGMRHEEDIAVTRAFVIAHSAGAAITRLYIDGRGDLPFLRDENYREGDLVGFISLVGMHTGSVIAEHLWRLLTISPAPVVEEARFLAAAMGYPIDRGMIADSRYTSSVVRELPGSTLQVPVHPLWASGATGIQTGLLWSLTPFKVRYPVKLLDHFGGDLNDVLIGGCQNDGLLFALTQIGQLNYPDPVDPDAVTELEYSSFPAPPLFSFHWTVAHEWPASDTVVRLLTDRIRGTAAHDRQWCAWDPSDGWLCKGFPDNSLLPEQAFSGCDNLASPTAAYRDPPTRAGLPKSGPDTSAGGLAIVSPASGAFVAPGQPLSVEVSATGGYQPDRVSVVTSEGQLATDADGPPFVFDLTLADEAIGSVEIFASGLKSGNTEIRRSEPVTVEVDLGGIGLEALEVQPSTLVLSPTSSYSRLATRGHFTDGVRRRIDPSAPGLAYGVTHSAVATIDSEGFAHAHAPGVTEVEVSFGGRTDTVKVVVVNVPLILTHDGPSISWPAQNNAIGYDVVVGDLGVLRTSGGDFATAVGSCLVDDTPSPQVTHEADPPSGEGLFYLVRSVISEANVLSYDVDWTGGQIAGRDAPIEASGASCP